MHFEITNLIHYQTRLFHEQGGVNDIGATVRIRYSQGANYTYLVK
jgi:hypothetical protein